MEDWQPSQTQHFFFLRYLQGQILIFFDAHVEMTAGWLEPLLANIAADRSLIAVPHIDWITSSTMKFDALENYQFSRYSWALGLYWYELRN